MQAARPQQPVGKDMAAFGIGAKLDLVYRDEIGTDFQRHRLDRADPIGGAVGHDPLFPRHQRHHRGAALRHDAVVNLTRKKAQRQADNPGAMRQHPVDREMGFAGIGRPKDRRDPGGHIHHAALKILTRQIGFQPLDRGIYLSQMRIDSLGGAVGFQRLFRAADLFEDHRQTGQSPEMPWVQIQRAGDIRNRGAKIAGLVIGGGARVIALGKIRGVVDKSSEMFDRRAKIPRGHGIAAPFQQQIHRRRSGF